jgi:hypothetical protein
MPSASDVQPLKTGLQFASEIVIPGGSNLIAGNYSQAAIHAGLGLVAGRFSASPLCSWSLPIPSRERQLVTTFMKRSTWEILHIRRPLR